MFNKSIAFRVILFFCITLRAQNFPVKAIIENGPRDERVNMVFLGDGYQLYEMAEYEKDVQNTVDKIFSEKPYNNYKRLFNVYAIEVPSNESGTDHPGTAADCSTYKDSVFARDTYFNTTFDFGGIHRLLVAQNNNAVNNVLINNFPDYDMVLMIVNHRWYGGSGGSISVFSTDTQSSEIAIHEAGHSFAHLADEYGGTSNNKIDGINVTMQTNRENIPWAIWIDPKTPLPTPAQSQYLFNTIGLFEGAFYSDRGMYRPKYQCKMRILGVPFCEICLEQHIKTLLSYFDLIGSHLPDDSQVVLFTNEKRNFSIDTLKLGLSNIAIDWKIDGQPEIQNSNMILLDGSQLSIGAHTLTVNVIYKSDQVKNDPENLMESTYVWSVEVKSPTGVNWNNQLSYKFSLEQNYPNPFNPSTEISYQISEFSKVQLKIFDMLGSELVTLVDEYKQPGLYKAEFSGSRLNGNGKLPSGIYFYRLTSGNHSITKKMITLK